LRTASPGESLGHPPEQLEPAVHREGHESGCPGTKESSRVSEEPSRGRGSLLGRGRVLSRPRRRRLAGQSDEVSLDCTSPAAPLDDPPLDRRPGDIQPLGDLAHRKQSRLTRSSMLLMIGERSRFWFSDFEKPYFASGVSEDSALRLSRRGRPRGLFERWRLFG